MSLTILNTPTSPNVTGTNLIYTISSSVVPAFQYRYLVDVYESGSATRLARFKYPQNSSGTVNIDLGRVLDDYLDYDYNWKTDTLLSSSTNSKRFTIEFGDEYGTSYTSAVTSYPSQVTSSISVFKGNIQYPSVGAYNDQTNQATIATSSINFNNLSYAQETTATQQTMLVYADRTLSNNPNMLNYPITSKYNPYENIDLNSNNPGEDIYVSASKGWYVAQPIGTEDYGTETYLNAYIPNDTETLSTSFFLYNDNNELIWYGRVPTAPLDTRTSSSAQTLTYPAGFKNYSSVENITQFTASLGTGPLSASISSSNQWSWYALSTVTQNQTQTSGIYHYYYNEDKGPDTLFSFNSGSTPAGVNYIRPALWANKHYPTYCNNEKTRFAFINSFGAWDYYNVYMPTRRVTNIDRKIYEQPRLNLNQRQTTYNVSNRGETQYYTEYTDDFEITTDIIDSQESQWLRELFESTEVYIQSGSNFIPINILNTTEQIINSSARNKQFQYTIRYQFSNLREPR